MGGEGKRGRGWCVFSVVVLIVVFFGKKLH